MEVSPSAPEITDEVFILTNRDDCMNQQQYIRSLWKTIEDLLEIIGDGEEYTRRLRAQLAEVKKVLKRVFGDRNAVKMEKLDLKKRNDRLETDNVDLEETLAQERKENAQLFKRLQDAERMRDEESSSECQVGELDHCLTQQKRQKAHFVKHLHDAERMSDEESSSECQVGELDHCLTQQKRQKAHFVKHLHDAERKFNAEALANMKEIQRINDEFAQREASLKEKMIDGRQKRETKIAEQKITELQKKLQKKKVEAFNLTQQLQNEKCGAARQRYLQSQTKKNFDEIMIALQKGKKNVFEMEKQTKTFRVKHHTAYEACEMCRSEKKQKSPGKFKKILAWLCQGKRKRKMTF
uniref:GRB10-interacting GYF protein 2-like isoform X2 n=1 Tax=Myxine glutinosa TaxID=7769 RepID=UPI00358F2E15